MSLSITSDYLAIDNVHPNPHSGIDVAIPIGTPLLSVGHGFVEKVTDYGATNIGRGVYVRLLDGNQVIYGHLSEISVKEGQPLLKGELIGLSGNTGHSTGPHLHLQYYTPTGKLEDPTRYLTAAVGSPAVPSPPSSFAGFDLISAVAIGMIIVVLMFFVGGKKMMFTPVSVIVMVVICIFLGPKLWVALGTLFQTGFLDVPLIVATIIGIWLWQLGAQWPKRYLFWSWIVFWTFRGFVFS